MKTATRVPEENGVYLFDWCPTCKDDLLFHVVPIEYHMFYVHYYFICVRCMNKHFDRQEAGAEYPSLGIEEEKLFYADTRKDNEEWNDWIKFGGIERF